MPEQEMKKYEVLAVLVRSKVGLIEETTPWYVSYINKAREMNIV